SGQRLRRRGAGAGGAGRCREAVSPQNTPGRGRHTPSSQGDALGYPPVPLRGGRRGAAATFPVPGRCPGLSTLAPSGLERSVPDVAHVVGDAGAAEEVEVFLLETARAVVLLLAADVAADGVDVAGADREGAVAVLPVEALQRPPVGLHPLGGTFLDLL